MLITALALAAVLAPQTPPETEPSAVPVQAAAPPAPRPAIQHPSWRRIPDQARVQAAFARYPEGGTMRLSCTVAADGALQDCEPHLPAAGSEGAGRAAMSLIPMYRVDVNSVDLTRPNRMIFTIRWMSREDWAESESY